MNDKFDVILADPPSEFRVWDKETGNGRSAERHYPTMSVLDLCKMPVEDYAADNCALFIWACWPTIFEYIPPLLWNWGFVYKTLGFEWWKLNKRWHTKWTPMAASLESFPVLEKLFFMGMGYYTRANSEPCLLAVKGKMPVKFRGERNYIIAPIREHSQKPDQQYEKIQRLYPGARCLELFARKKQPGWSSFGNEIESDIKL